MGESDGRDPEAFRVLYRDYYRPVCRYLAVRADRSLVEDVAADTFLVAWRRQSEIPGYELPWLLNVARRCLANQRRARERVDAVRERLASTLTADGVSVLEDDVQRREHCRALADALAGLGDADRDVVLLRYWDGLAPRDIARLLEINPVVARARVHRASAKVRRVLADRLESGSEGPAGLLNVQDRVRIDGDLEGASDARAC